MRAARGLGVALALMLAGCGEDEVGCVLTYDRCPGGNPCEPLCLFEDEAPTCTDTVCPQPNEPEGECQLFANECVFR